MTECFVVYELIHGGDQFGATFNVIGVYTTQESAYKVIAKDYQKYLTNFDKLQNEKQIEFLAGDFLYKVGVVKKILK
jgi:hypothetical protein